MKKNTLGRIGEAMAKSAGKLFAFTGAEAKTYEDLEMVDGPGGVPTKIIFHHRTELVTDLVHVIPFREGCICRAQGSRYKCLRVEPSLSGLTVRLGITWERIGKDYRRKASKAAKKRRAS